MRSINKAELQKILTQQCSKTSREVKQDEVIERRERREMKLPEILVGGSVFNTVSRRGKWGAAEKKPINAGDG